MEAVRQIVCHVTHLGLITRKTRLQGVLSRHKSTAKTTTTFNGRFEVPLAKFSCVSFVMSLTYDYFALLVPYLTIFKNCAQFLNYSNHLAEISTCTANM